MLIYVLNLQDLVCVCVLRTGLICGVLSCPIQLELMSITKKSSSREGAEEICTWGCKCVVVTNSEGATAFVNSSYVAAENSDQVYGMTASDVLADRKVVLVEHKQSAFPAEVTRIYFICICTLEASH